MSKRRTAKDIVYKKQYAGFMQRGSYIEIQPQPDGESSPCLLSCGDPGCQEWNDTFILPGETTAEAQKSQDKGDYAGVAYHVAECEMLDPETATDS